MSTSSGPTVILSTPTTVRDLITTEIRDALRHLKLAEKNTIKPEELAQTVGINVSNHLTDMSSPPFDMLPNDIQLSKDYIATTWKYFTTMYNITSESDQYQLRQESADAEFEKNLSGGEVG
ncbi:hypothetical protein LTR95_015637 [Oleoguttula sp. CCFEE 5521]